MLQHEINEFGQRLGLPGLSLNDRGLASLVMEGVGTLTLQTGEGPAEDRLILSVAMPVESSEAATRFESALERVHWKNALPVDLSVALFRDHLIWAARLPVETVTASGLENAFRLILAEAERNKA